MKVHELVEILKSAEPDADVFVASDEEGNSYRLASVDLNQTMIDQNDEWYHAHPLDIERGEYDDWKDEMVPAVVFW